MVSSHLRIDSNLPHQSTIFIGDSITQGLAVSAITSPSVNYGIGHDTTYGVIQRIDKYQSLESAKAVVLAIGYNDLKRRSNDEIIENYQRILKTVPEKPQIIISAILPLDERVKGVFGNKRIRDINAALNTISKQTPNTKFIDATENLLDASQNLAQDYHEGDGIHLSSEGYKVWINALKEVAPE